MITSLIILSIAFIYSRFKDYVFKRDTVEVIDRLNKDNEFLYGELIKVNGHVLELIDHINPEAKEHQERVTEEIRQAMMN